MHIRYDPDEWKPELPGAVHTRATYTDKLTPGTLVAWDRQPYRVIEVREREQANWPDAYREAWVQQGMPDPSTWYYRPRVVVLKPEDDPNAKQLNLQGPNSARWCTLPEHYPLCRLCHELPPCRHVHTERIMDRATEKMAETMAILPGTCHACKEPITKRQKSFTFPGPNLIRPDLGDNSAVFHTRGACSGLLESYDKRWAAAETGRARFFYCPGTFTLHHDDSGECSQPDCVAKGALKDLVEHALWLRHHPRMQEASGCWCLAGVLS